MAEKKCYLCGRNGSCDPLDRHHVFNGANKAKSEKYGALVYLCHADCHIFGVNSVHRNIKVRRKLQREFQQKIMDENGWDTDDFIREFGRNYL